MGTTTTGHTILGQGGCYKIAFQKWKRWKMKTEFQFGMLKVCAFAYAVVNVKSAHLHNYMSFCALLLLTGAQG